MSFRHLRHGRFIRLIITKLCFSLFHHYLRISRVFDCVKKGFYILLLFLGSVSLCNGQEKNAPISMGFADSLRIVMENSRNLDASVVGGAFVIAWNNMTLDIQQRIKQQTSRMKKKGYKLRPHMLPYFWSIVNAVNVEGIDPTQLNNYLKVADKVIENYRTDKASNFL